MRTGAISSGAQSRSHSPFRNKCMRPRYSTNSNATSAASPSTSRCRNTSAVAAAFASGYSTRARRSCRRTIWASAPRSGPTDGLTKPSRSHSASAVSTNSFASRTPAPRCAISEATAGGDRPRSSARQMAAAVGLSVAIARCSGLNRISCDFRRISRPRRTSFRGSSGGCSVQPGQDSDRPSLSVAARAASAARDLPADRRSAARADEVRSEPAAPPMLGWLGEPPWARAQA